jgi:hypothetical protein
MSVRVPLNTMKLCWCSFRKIAEPSTPEVDVGVPVTIRLTNGAAARCRGAA